ncbi:hypothetical protein F5Y09DRAFT_236024 [Xylaria sp. FL1042]|nr:hypothetical protein F5Y09DRAFT_236024 [Xylaria sp. FL1042]
MYSLTQQLESFKSQEQELVRKRAAVNSELSAVRKKQKPIETQVDKRKESMRTKRSAAGISEELWREYEAFCETLQPNGGGKRRSFVWNENYNDSYIEYDPKLEALKSAVEPGNWRCECVASYTKSGTPIGYLVDYFAVKAPKDRSWGDSFPTLYDGALDAARQGSVVALKMLVALPLRYGWARAGWAFEFRFKESCSSHPNLSRRWGFRAAHSLCRPVANESKRNDLIREYGLPFEIEDES